jgi:hypothetical protein
MTPVSEPRQNGPRRYLAIVQDERGYPAPGDDPDDGPPDGPKPPMLHSVVLADEFDVLRTQADRYRAALEEIRTHALASGTWVGADFVVYGCNRALLDPDRKETTP